MTKSIEQIALEVVEDLGWSLDAVEHSDMQEFLRRCLAKIGEGLEPVSYATSNEDGDLTMLFFDKQEALTYCYGDTPVSLYANPHEAIIAAEQLVAEACRKLAEKRSCKAADSWDIGFNSASDDIANAIRSGEWRKYIKE